MTLQDTAPGRRRFLTQSAALVAATITQRLFAQTQDRLDVASAGSFKAMLEGPLKTASSAALHLDLYAHSQGADAVAKSLVAGSLHADIFIPITAGPMQTVLNAGKATLATPIARTELVLVYSPKGRYAAQLAAPDARWWELLQQPGIRIGRSDPAADPGGRTILFAMMLAAKKFRQPDLVQRILGPTLNPAQIVPGAQAGLKDGSIDAATSYKTAAIASGLPYITLPPEINLVGDSVHADNPDVMLHIGDKTFYPEPLVFYAALLKDAANPTGATRWLTWLKSEEGQTILRQNHFDAPGHAPSLHA